MDPTPKKIVSGKKSNLGGLLQTSPPLQHQQQLPPFYDLTACSFFFPSFFFKIFLAEKHFCHLPLHSFGPDTTSALENLLWQKASPPFRWQTEEEEVLEDPPPPPSLNQVHRRQEESSRHLI